jgi:uncharacterized protein HemX
VNHFEDELRAALRRQEPPAGFLNKVVTRARPQKNTSRKGWMAAAMAACLLLGAGGVLEYRQYEGRKAKRELLLALHIAGSKLNIAQQKVLDLNRRIIHD